MLLSLRNELNDIEQTAKAHYLKNKKKKEFSRKNGTKFELEDDMLNIILLEEHLSIKIMTLLEKGKDYKDKDSDSDEGEGEDGSDKDNSSDEDSDGNSKDEDDEDNQAVNITIK